MAQKTHELTDLPAPPRPARLPRDEESLDGEPPADEFDADRELPGAILMIPDRHWGFEVSSATDHPGACTHHRAEMRDAVLVKGTDAEHVNNPLGYFAIEPSSENGLQKRTAFQLVPRYFRLHRLKLLYVERCLGRLDDDTLQALRAELARLHPDE